MTEPQASGELITPNLRFCDVAKVNISLAYDTFGSPTSPALLLVMGLNAQKTLWSVEFCALLAASGPFYVIRFDNRDVGFSTKIDHQGVPGILELMCPGCCCCLGGTPNGQGRYRLEDMSLDAWALLDYLKLTNVYLMGASMGGMIAQVMSLQQPPRVLGLVSIMSTTGAKDLPTPPLSAWKELAKKPKSTNIKDMVAWNVNLVKNVMTVGTTSVPDDYILKECTEVMTRSVYGGGAERQTYAIQVNATPREPLLKKLKVPTLVLHGKNDVLLPLAHGQRTAAVIPGV